MSDGLSSCSARGRAWQSVVLCVHSRIWQERISLCLTPFPASLFLSVLSPSCPVSPTLPTSSSLPPRARRYVEFCKADDTEILGNSSFPLKVSEAPVTALQPSCEYKIRLRLEVRHLPSAGPTLSSSWTAGVFRTLDVAGIPPPPPRPVVHRVSSTLSEVTILAAPCKTGDECFCAESYLLQRIDGAVPEDDSREEEWKSVPEVTCSCTHPKVRSSCAPTPTLTLAWLAFASFWLAFAAFDISGSYVWDVEVLQRSVR